MKKFIAGFVCGVGAVFALALVELAVLANEEERWLSDHDGE